MSGSDRIRRAAALLLGVAALAPALAQQASREQELIRRLRQQVQQLQQELAAQQQAAQQAGGEKAELQRRVDGTQNELTRLRAAAAREAQAAGAAAQQLEATRQALQVRVDEQQAELERRAAELTKMRAELEHRQRSLDERDAAFVALDARHRTQGEGLQTCIANNMRLVAIGKEVLQRYAEMTVPDLLERKEPFLQFHRVAMENLVQGYEDKLDQQLLRKPAAGARP